MNKKYILIAALVPLMANAQNDQIYLSSKKDEEMVAKLFEITRRMETNTYLGKWRQDMMKSITLDCAIQTKVINEKRKLLLPNEVYSPVLRKEDVLYLNTFNIKIGTYKIIDTNYCYKIAEQKPSELFSNCYVANILAEGHVRPNKDYPREYLVVDSEFKNGSKITAGMYCEAIRNDPKTRQFATVSGTATWTNPPSYKKVNFVAWSENLMIGTVQIQVEGFDKPYYMTTIYK